MAFMISFLVTILAFFSSSVSAASCSSADVAQIRSSAAHPLTFCNFYLSIPRTRTPFKKLSMLKTKKACKCIVRSRSDKSTFKRTAPAIKSPSPRCSVKDMAAVQDAFSRAKDFCVFWIPPTDRERRPIPNLTVDRTNTACICIKGQKPPAVKTSSIGTMKPITRRPRNSFLSSSSALLHNHHKPDYNYNYYFNNYDYDYNFGPADDNDNNINQYD
ncbi:hypothetical protein BDZ85DRAFT_283648 [Elsinoe ampelina]|uniref:Uncharacterized protein n=1 Tax=Elsinoe ampelina TaxID=302913 RepID=A0A6A6G749_9PEZI|nr:hypothetical protein BDZ85DRAFT_283648 [Elsinoe ampelina]